MSKATKSLIFALVVCSFIAVMIVMRQPVEQPTVMVISPTTRTIHLVGDDGKDVGNMTFDDEITVTIRRK